MTAELQKRHPNWSIALAEKYKGLGGRTYSYPYKKSHWEMGAGRIHKSHKLLMGLVKKYGLTWLPISKDFGFKAGPNIPIEPNPFESLIIPTYIQPLSYLSPNILANHTLEELMNKLYGSAKTQELFSYFPYRAEVNTLRADLALAGFLEGEMSSNDGYGILAEGFSELIARLRSDVEEKGAVILPRHRLINLEKADGHDILNSATDLKFTVDKDIKITLRAQKLTILALHKDAIEDLFAFKDWSTLKHLKTRPLLRTYAVFNPKNVWFAGLGRIVTPARPRFILPMDPSNGIIQISYTHSENTSTYMKLQGAKGDKALEALVMSDIRALFPELKIPKPLFFKSHPWTTGATYWLPGSYDPVTESKKACHPLAEKLPSVWLTGESWSLRQAWVEGALEQSEQCLALLDR